MLDTDTKRRIDSARDILVGKVPDPKSQVDQITIALIYKFMDDMDAESEVLGGKRKFFAGEWACYGWPKLMRSGLGGHEVLNLYGEAIARMPENPGIPVLFRDIFKNVFLPYRDPETLKSFLKIIDEFEYDHSERLGDAFEYLLSVLGSQGDAGQFRTPRHIIDFMVKVINPKKNETVLDPACGTAGFLISAYKHILRNNKDKKGNNTLTPDEKGRLAKNLKGYDISPDMVRLSLVNLYLHGFIDPHIDEYDTLTSDDKWNEYADVILANPPFMSPKGGIKPHKRFSIQAKRSEVLFVDYMAEHLTPQGRAAIIVPEGIIFRNQTAYKQLRKMLIDEYLVAVVSLPAGVFQPYSGVKTSVLILDKLLSKRSSEILFLKVNNDGTDLGARRKAVSDSNLPDAMNTYRKWTATFTAEEHETSIENLPERLALVVPKAKILADGDFDLTFERYRDARPTTDGTFPMARIGDLVSETSTRVRDNEVPVWSVSNALGFVNTGEYFSRQVASKDIANYKIVGPYCFAYNPSRINVGSIALNHKGEDGAVSPMYVVFNVSDNTLSHDYLFLLLKSAELNREFNRVAQGGVRVQVRFKELSKIQIPLPPLEIQKEIVAEIEGYQKVIDGARAVLDNYRPHIPIHPDWPMVPLGEVAELIRGITFRKAEQLESAKDNSLLVATTKAAQESGIVDDYLYHIPRSLLKNESKLLRHGDILISTANSLNLLGRTTHVRKVERPMSFGAFMSLIRRNNKILDGYLIHCLRTPPAFDFFFRNANTTTNISNLNLSALAQFPIPLPPLATQQAIVAEIEAEQALVTASRELIERMEQKIQTTLARIWGEEEATTAKANLLADSAKT